MPVDYAVVPSVRAWRIVSDNTGRGGDVNDVDRSRSAVILMKITAL